MLAKIMAVMKIEDNEMTKYLVIRNNKRSEEYTDTKGQSLDKLTILWPVYVRKGKFVKKEEFPNELTCLDEFVICRLSDKIESEGVFLGKLSKEFGTDFINKNLLKKVFSSCDAYITYKNKKVFLNAAGKRKKNELLRKVIADDAEDVCAFQDRVTKGYFPCFDVSDLGNFEKEEENALLPDFSEDVQMNINLSQLYRSYKKWLEIQSSHVIDDVEETDADDSLEEDAPVVSLHLPDDTFKKEAEMQDGEPNPFNFLYECYDDIPDENETFQKNDIVPRGDVVKKKAKFNRLSDERELYLDPQQISENHFIAFDLVFNPSCSDAPIVVSPFGKKYDEFFTRYFSVFIKQNIYSPFSKKIQNFIESCKEKYKDQFVFAETWGNQFLQRFPRLSNYPQFDSVRYSIASLNGMSKAPDPNLYKYDVFRNLRSTYEVFLKEILYKRKDKLKKEIVKCHKNLNEIMRDKRFDEIISFLRDGIHNVADEGNDCEGIYDFFLSEESYKDKKNGYGDDILKDLLKFIYYEKSKIYLKSEICFLYLYKGLVSSSNDREFIDYLDKNIDDISYTLYNISEIGNGANHGKKSSIERMDINSETARKIYQNTINHIQLLAAFC